MATPTEILKQYEGYRVYNPQGQAGDIQGGKFVLVNTGMADMPFQTRENEAQILARLRQDNPYSGLKPTSNIPTDVYNLLFYKTPIPETQASEPVLEYTGKTVGTTSGGKILYQLKNGEVTSKAPPAGVQITGDVTTQTPTVSTTTTPSQITPITNQPTSASTATANTAVAAATSIVPTGQGSRPDQVRDVYVKYFDRVPTEEEFKFHAEHQTPLDMLESWAKTHPQSVIKETTPTTSTTTQQATLSSPDGKYKTVVKVGSQEAKQLQQGGWMLGDEGKKVLDSSDAVNIKTPTTEAPKETTTPPKTVAGKTAASATAAAKAEPQLATLYDPIGKQPTQVVEVGSKEAQALQAQGWALTKPSGRVLSAEETVGEAVYRGEGAYIKFLEDPDGAGPQSTSTVFYVDPKTKSITPILSEQAFQSYFGRSIADAEKEGRITTLPNAALSQGNIFGGFSLKPDTEGIGSTQAPAPQAPEVQIATDRLKERYGKAKDSELEKAAFSQIDGLFSLIKNNAANTGISSALIDEISKDPTVVGAYINAFAYGGYQVNDLFRDLKRKQLVKDGRTDLNNVKVIDESVPATTYYTSESGQSIRTNPDLTPPQFIGDIDTSLFNFDIFKIPAEAYQTLVPPFDWKSQEGQAEMDKIKSAYHDVMLKQLEATTAQEKAAADYDYNKLKGDIQREYGITLSNRANEAWNQLESLGATMQTRGLASSGLTEEAQAKYLADVRKQNQQLATQELDKETQAKRDYLLKYGTSEQINALSSEEKTKLGLKPSAETSQWFSKENLKSLYPNLSAEEIANYSSMIIDPSGNYRSELYQKLYGNKFDIQQDKRAYQLGTVQRDDSGNIIGGYGALYKKALEEEEKYRPFSTSEKFVQPKRSDFSGM